jgi:hypothetical protein
MPVTKTITLYSFDELSEEAQEKAIEKLRDLNVDCQWWECTCEDAKRAGLDITEFDIDHNIIKGKLTDSLLRSIRHILDDHGEDCDTHAVAKRYLDEYIAAAKEWHNLAGIDLGPVDDLNDLLDKADEIANDYRKEMLEEYLSILRSEYDYLTSKKVIVETIQANEYLFTEDGELS